MLLIFIHDKSFFSLKRFRNKHLFCLVGGSIDYLEWEKLRGEKIVTVALLFKDGDLFKVSQLECYVLSYKPSFRMFWVSVDRKKLLDAKFQNPQKFIMIK